MRTLWENRESRCRCHQYRIVLVLLAHRHQRLTSRCQLPSIVTATMRFTGPAEVLHQILLGDRDILLEDRAAVVIAVGSLHQAGGRTEVDVTLRLGADEEPDGLRYRGRMLRPGAALPFVTERYVLEGSLLRVKRDARGSK